MTLTLDDVSVAFEGDDNVATITILRGDDVGVKFKYGKVEFDEGGDQTNLNYHYDLVSGQPLDIPKFERAIGDLLVAMIEQFVRENKVIYTGGVDEN